MRNLPALRGVIRQILDDEYVTGTTQEWDNDELDVHIGQVLIEVSEASPLGVKETVTTTASSKDVSISAIENLLWVSKVEYPVDQSPRAFKKFSVFGTTLTIDCDRLPAAGESVYLYCSKLHTLTNTSSSLSPILEKLIVDGTCAYAALSKARKLENAVNVGGANTPNQLKTWGMERLMLYRQGLSKVTVPQDYTEYSKA